MKYNISMSIIVISFSHEGCKHICLKNLVLFDNINPLLHDEFVAFFEALT